MDAAKVLVPADRPDDGLTRHEQAILAFERQWWKRAGAKEQAIEDRFGMSSTRYYQLLNRLLDDREAMRAEPALVNRLRRLRDGRQRLRAARLPDVGPR
ncbi:MAG: DUF3263 domain-containing protein [Kutzneria sp.]|nr:DUF3263 domain-containing protein [Kutzneria sp.]